MVVISRIEQAVLIRLISNGECCFINDAFSHALSMHRAEGVLSTVICSPGGVINTWREQLGIVLLEDTGYVVSATVVDFHILSVE